MTQQNADKKPHQEPPKLKDSETSAKAALHGQSLFARIRRGALPILVSVGGTLILALQTYILHQQTGLIAKQTEALQLDQSAHLREHIVAASEEEANVKRLLSSLESGASFEINGDGLGGVVTVKDFSPDACLNPHCSNASLSQALAARGGRVEMWTPARSEVATGFCNTFACPGRQEATVGTKSVCCRKE